MYSRGEGRRVIIRLLKQTLEVRIAVFLFLFIFLAIPFGVLAGISHLLIRPDLNKKIYAWWHGAQFTGTEGVILQDKFNNCGPAAMKMVLMQFGIKTSLADIERLAGTDARGTSMLGLKQMAESCGLRAEGWRFVWEDFRKIDLPAILFVNGDHYVTALEFIGKDTLILADPAIGKLKICQRNLKKIWKGETLVLSK